MSEFEHNDSPKYLIERCVKMHQSKSGNDTFKNKVMENENEVIENEYVVTQLKTLPVRNIPSLL